MDCCANCFGDEYLRDEIERSEDSVRGRCGYCGSEAVSLIQPETLRDRFETLLGVYSELPGGSPLITLLREDWHLFSNGCLADLDAIRLLGEILEDKGIGERRFVPLEGEGKNSLESWQNFCEELRYDNRFFIATGLDLDRIRDLLGYLEAKPSEVPLLLFRARLQDGDRPFQVADMGPPPAKLASHGRANPPGIPYLYLASDPRTAISELRPHTGDMASVAEFLIKPYLRFVDLRHPRASASPFKIDDETRLILLRRDLSFLDQLGVELTRPVLPKSAHIDYLPSQYLCEFIKHCGYDGVIYRSSVGDGVNYALFYPTKANPSRVSVRKVDRVYVEISEEQGP